VNPFHLSFFVPGIPQSRGSKKPFIYRKKEGGQGVAMSDDNPKSKAWMSVVALAASAAMAGREPLVGPVRIFFTFIMPRPASHFGSGRNSKTLKPGAPEYHTQKPDGLKLCRGVEDALTGIVYKDDALNCLGSWEKRWAAPGERPGCRLEVEELAVRHASMAGARDAAPADRVPLVTGIARPETGNLF
jgi:Holliday junction resolvase RusA-like endonuclease